MLLFEKPYNSQAQERRKIRLESRFLKKMLALHSNYLYNFLNPESLALTY